MGVLGDMSQLNHPLTQTDPVRLLRERLDDPTWNTGSVGMRQSCSTVVITAIVITVIIIIIIVTTLQLYHLFVLGCSATRRRSRVWVVLE